MAKVSDAQKKAEEKMVSDKLVQNLFVFLNENPFFLPALSQKLRLDDAVHDPNLAVFREGQRSVLNLIQKIYQNEYVKHTEEVPKKTSDGLIIK